KNPQVIQSLNIDRIGDRYFYFFPVFFEREQLIPFGEVDGNPLNHIKRDSICLQLAQIRNPQLDADGLQDVLGSEELQLNQGLPQFNALFSLDDETLLELGLRQRGVLQKNVA